MAFRTGDFKKTTRAGILYPYQIKDDRFTASISYAIGYYERMLGRQRGEFEADTLLEFFGDPRLARGLVACLGRFYAWRQQTFADIIGAGPAADLRRHNLSTPMALRARHYEIANAHFGGMVLPAQRKEALALLCEGLPLQPKQAEQLLQLDAAEQALLTRLLPRPTPDSIVALYNYHSLESALRRSDQLRLQLRGAVWPMVRSLHNLSHRYPIRYEIETPSSLFDDQLEVTLYGTAGGQQKSNSQALWAGKRLSQVILHLLAAHPNTLQQGEAQVRLGDKLSTCKLDGRALNVLGVEARANSAAWGEEAWENDVLARFQKQWSRAYLRGRTDGWRLRRDPEPLVSDGTVVVPDFICMRGTQRVYLCIANGKATTEALIRDLKALGSQAHVVLLAPARWNSLLKNASVPVVSYQQAPSEAIEALSITLERAFPRASGRVLTPWQKLERVVAEEGFMGEEQAAALIGCSSEDLGRTIQRWGGPHLHYLSGLGVCSPSYLPELRRLIDEGNDNLRQAA